MPVLLSSGSHSNISIIRSFSPLPLLLCPRSLSTFSQSMTNVAPSPLPVTAFFPSLVFHQPLWKRESPLICMSVADCAWSGQVPALELFFRASSSLRMRRLPEFIIRASMYCRRRSMFSWITLRVNHKVLIMFFAFVFPCNYLCVNEKNSNSSVAYCSHA